MKNNRLIDLRHKMSKLSGRNALIIIPKSQFCEEELYGVKYALKQAGVRVVVLSKSGQEALSMNRKKYKPDGMVVDWDKQAGIGGKYHVVILVGGKGARKSLLDDPIVPQILTDHYRSGSVIGALGSAIIVLMRASLILGEIPLLREELAKKELEALGAVCIDTLVTSEGRVVLGQGKNAVKKFSQTILDLIKVQNVF